MNDIKEDFVSLETAKLLKEKGFDVPVLVHIGSWMEKDCPHFVADNAKRKEVTCNYMEGELFSFYVSS